MRIILSSSQAGDVVCDPFSGTGTTLVAAHQLKRQGLGIEIDSANAVLIQDRLAKLTDSDLIYERFYTDYRYTDNLDTIWGMSGTSTAEGQQDHVYNLPLF